MFEQAFRSIDDILWKKAGCTTEPDYTEQIAWLLPCVGSLVRRSPSAGKCKHWSQTTVSKQLGIHDLTP
jgi:hypothetical protein